MVNYQHGIIYKIACKETGEVYFGSTCQSLAVRMTKHRSDVNSFDTGKKDRKCTSYALVKRNNYEVIILEKFPTTEKFLLNQRERYWIESEKCVNKVIPTRPKAEGDKIYYHSRKEELKEKRAPYFTEYNSKESTKERKHNWYVENCEKSKEACIERRKEKVECETCGLWYTKCRRSEHIKQQNHQWSVDNNMKYVKYDKDKLVNCECGVTYKLGRKADHLKTKKHKDYLAKE